MCYGGGVCVMVGVECVLWWGWSVCYGRGGVCVMVGVECVSNGSLMALTPSPIQPLSVVSCAKGNCDSVALLASKRTALAFSQMDLLP